MLTFIVRRILAAFFIVLGASFIVYMLMANAGDPLAFTTEIQNPTTRAAVIRTVTEALQLDVHPVVRYFHWLGDLFSGDFGISARTQQPVHRRPRRASPDDAQARQRRHRPLDRDRHRGRHRHCAEAVLGLRLHHDVLHLRLLLASRVLGRGHPQVGRSDRLQRLAARGRRDGAVAPRPHRARSAAHSASASRADRSDDGSRSPSPASRRSAASPGTSPRPAGCSIRASARSSSRCSRSGSRTASPP